jgi:outer membrane protein assembly factor BamD (BamD/ComL family)
MSAMLGKPGTRNLLSAIVVAALWPVAVWGQGPVRGRIESPRDPVLEINAKHNLDVAKWYLTKRKAYAGARDRLQEIVDTYPEFSRIDEVFYLMAEANEKLGKNEEAIENLKKLLKEYPDSEFAKKAREQLDKLGREKGPAGD